MSERNLQVFGKYVQRGLVGRAYFTDALKPNIMKIIQASLSHKLSRIVEQQSFALRYRRQFDLLTPREVEILRLLAGGHSNTEVAKDLHLSLHTVKNHRKHIKSKLEVRTTVELIHYALAFDLI